MILEEETFEAFGYYPKDLKIRSHMNILAYCERCGEFRITAKNIYRYFCHSCSRILGETQKGKNHYNFGKHRSEEQKAKISAALKGDKNPMFGRIGKMSPRFGKHQTEDAKELQSVAKKSDKNPNWRGGISFEPYCIKFDEAYKQLVRVKFNNRCFWCGSTTEENGQALSVHHANYNKNCGCDDTKCICVPLCMRCHGSSGSDREGWEEKIMKKLEMWRAEEQ